MSWLIWGIFNRLLKLRHLIPLSNPSSRLFSRLRVFATVRSPWPRRFDNWATQIRTWALQAEETGAREFRRDMLATYEIQHHFAPYTPYHVYEMLRQYILTSRWEPPVQSYPFLLPFLTLMPSLFMPLVVLLPPLLDATFELQWYLHGPVLILTLGFVVTPKSWTQKRLS